MYKPLKAQVINTLILKILILISGLFVFSPREISAQQLKSFSTDTAEYIEQLEEFMYNKNYKKELEGFMEVFTDLIYHNAYVQNQFARIVSTSNNLLKKRAKNYPHFENYLRCIMLFNEYHKDTSDYTIWENELNRLLKTNRVSISQISTFLEHLTQLLLDNTINKSPTTHWKSNINNYSFSIYNDNFIIEFNNITLSCYTKNDSIQIFNTNGYFNPLKIHWYGTNGKITWERAGFSSDSVYANLNHYEINMKKSEYMADSVVFTNKFYFKEPLMGSLKDKVMNITQPEKASYPLFDSYSKWFNIDNIYEKVNYKGGFLMKGAKFIGNGTEDNPAFIEILRDIKIVEGIDTIVQPILFFTGASKYYVFTKDGVTSKNTEIKLKLDADSIYHPGLFFRYSLKDKELILIRSEDDENFSKSPYFDSYHQIDMDFELLSWKINQPFVDIKMIAGSQVNRARFESANFFSAVKYNKIQGIDRIHPYLGLYKFSKKLDTTDFTALQYAGYMRMPITQIRQQLMRLAYSGVIAYNFETEVVHIKDRLINYIDARYGRRDYDVIDFNSETSGSQINARLELSNFDMQIYGVPRIFLSDSQNVVLYPDKSKILLKKNRNFDFKGEIEAGLFTFYGQNFEFDYSGFKVNLNKIDSLRLKIIDENLDNWGREMLVNVKSVIENITGELLIDEPNNKSGIKQFSEYPIFDSKQNSYVYYDKQSIQNGAYPRDKVYFIIDPYTLDSLDNFSTVGLGFEGTFETSGIIPTIHEKLVVQDDNSLGFVHRTPKEGFPLYGGKGTFKNDIQISNHGLSGDGVFEYIYSTTYSNDFIFYPDSMNALANQFINEKQEKYPEFPVAYALDVKVHWDPGDEQYFIKTIKDPITMYDTRAYMNGTLKLKPNGFTGRGRMDFDEALLYSDNFVYGANLFNSSAADFILKTHDLTNNAFKTDSVKVNVDFKNDKAQFSSNEGVSKIEMPQNKYISYMEYFEWDLQKKEIEMSTNIYVTIIERGVSRLVEKEQKGSKPSGSVFMSVHPKQDSLNFVSPNAIFDVSNYIINASDVKFIKVADATIYPGDGEVKVLKNAKIKTLTNAEILANDSTRYHRFYNSNVNIFGRLNYSATGDYDYFDEVNRKQVIQFDLISVDDSLNTYAKGKIPETKKFTLSPVYNYYGEVQLFAKNKLLTFDGYAKINHECNQISKQWFAFKTEIDPNSIYIPISTPLVNNNNDDLYAGVFMGKDSVYLYPGFFNNKKSIRDISVVNIDEGYLHYDKNDRKYKIASLEKLKNNNLHGDFISLNRFFCTVFAEGELNFGVNLGQVKTQAFGNITNNIDKNTFVVDAMMTLDFFFAQPALDIMSDTINTNGNLRAINIQRPVYVNGLKSILGEEITNQLLDEVKLFGVYKKIPEGLNHNIVLTDLHLKWNAETESFQSIGKIGIGNIGTTQINKLVDGHVEIQRKRSGDVFTIYLEADRGNWFFFNYKRGLMQAYSSNDGFNNTLRNIKASKRKMEVPRGQEQYMYFLSNMTRKNQFLRQFEED